MNQRSDRQARFFAALRMTRIVVLALAVGVATATSSIAADLGEPKPSLEKVLLPLIKAHKGEVGLAVKNLKTGESYEYKADQPMPTASLIKLPIMIAAYDAVESGKLTLDNMIELKKEDQVPGSGVLTTHFSPGTKISLRDAIHLMMVYSDNTATNLVLDKLGLPTTNELMAKLECPETRVNSKVFRRDTSIAIERSQEYGLGSTTAADMVKLGEQLHSKKLVSEKASQQMLDHMFACEDKLKVPRMLPSGTRVAHKTGSVNSSRTDAGIIESPAGPIAFGILTNKNKDQRWVDDNEGDLFCANWRCRLQILQPETAVRSGICCNDVADWVERRFGCRDAANAQCANEARAQHRHRRRLWPRNGGGGKAFSNAREAEADGHRRRQNLEGARSAHHGG